MWHYHDYPSLRLQADMRFVWNGHLLRELVQQQELNRFCIPILHGCILSILGYIYKLLILFKY